MYVCSHLDTEIVLASIGSGYKYDLHRCTSCGVAIVKLKKETEGG